MNNESIIKVNVSAISLKMTRKSFEYFIWLLLECKEKLLFTLTWRPPNSKNPSHLANNLCSFYPSPRKMMRTIRWISYRLNETHPLIQKRSIPCIICYSLLSIIFSSTDKRELNHMNDFTDSHISLLINISYFWYFNENYSQTKINPSNCILINY